MERAIDFQMERIRLSEAGALLPDIEQILSRDELERIQTSAARRRLEFFAGRLCAKKALAALDGEVQKYSDISIRTDLWGCPYICGSNHFVSISHCDAMAAAVVSDIRYARVSVDLERVRDVRPDTWRRVIEEEERHRMEGMSDRERNERFGLCWSAKESAGKLFQYGFGVFGILHIESICRRDLGLYEIALRGLPLINVYGVVREGYVATAAAVFQTRDKDRRTQAEIRLCRLLDGMF